MNQYLKKKRILVVIFLLVPSCGGFVVQDANARKHSAALALNLQQSLKMSRPTEKLKRIIR
jgi:hypothetical protein